MQEDNASRGVLGEYGVLIVPPSGESDAWFVTLGAWDEESAGYIAGTDGPLVDSREDALQEAGKVLDWLVSQEDEETDLFESWKRLQEIQGVESGLIERSRYRPRGPMGL